MTIKEEKKIFWGFSGNKLISGYVKIAIVKLLHPEMQDSSSLKLYSLLSNSDLTHSTALVSKGRTLSRIHPNLLPYFEANSPPGEGKISITIELLKGLPALTPLSGGVAALAVGVGLDSINSKKGSLTIAINRGQI